ncbi:MAG TPA: YraN family protein [Syntrophomonadaceae bacterium]|mgnify:CR=1 FL=1|nr:YraN family protein [Syntrophomonadaceae bacterium]
MKKELGHKGEDLAASYLQKKGYRILQRNYRSKSGEIDIICCKPEIIVFVEVKTRTSKLYGSPEESITWRKRDHIRKTALDYLAADRRPFKELRFDVIGIMIEQGVVTKVNHLEGAF